MKNKNNEKINYKFVSLILTAVIVLAIFAGIVYYQKQISFQQGVQYGQENAVNIILQETKENGEMTIPTPNQNVSLVRSEYINVAQENIVQDIISSVDQRGNVTLTLDGQRITLVQE